MHQLLDTNNDRRNCKSARERERRGADRGTERDSRRQIDSDRDSKAEQTDRQTDRQTVSIPWYMSLHENQFIKKRVIIRHTMINSLTLYDNHVLLFPTELRVRT